MKKHFIILNMFFIVSAISVDLVSTLRGAEPETVKVSGNATLNLHSPLGLPPLPVPADNPMTKEKIELGKLLYFDKRLSKDGTISCATCHDPKMAWAEHKPTSTGINGQVGARNSPTVLNSAYGSTQFWDGRAATLEEQALGPIENPIEMGHNLKVLVTQLNALPEGSKPDYKGRFQKVFGTEITADGIAKALAAFERTVLTGNSPYDKYMAGDKTAMSEAQVRGLKLFEEARCASCHRPPIFSSFAFVNTGYGMDAEKPDQGRKDATGKDRDAGKFRVPHLRNIDETGPYYHDGKVKTLAEAVRIMAAGGVDVPNRSAMMKMVAQAKLSKSDQADIVEFLKALSGEYPVIEPPTYGDEK